jgi:hypothetical protein
MNIEYPCSIGCFRGTPVQFENLASPNTSGRRFNKRRGGSLTIIGQKLSIDINNLRRAFGSLPPSIDRAAQLLGIVAKRLHKLFKKNGPRGTR